MKYRKDRYGNELSQLGFGCMRFTRKGAQIDYAKAVSTILIRHMHMWEVRSAWEGYSTRTSAGIR